MAGKTLEEIGLLFGDENVRVQPGGDMDHHAYHEEDGKDQERHLESGLKH
jgi:hypothetical protein